MALVAVGLSGGVDSSLAAVLLKEQGHTVIGITMKLYNGQFDGMSLPENSCFGPHEDKSIALARAVADTLEIEHIVVDLSEVFVDNITSYIVDEYKKGRTPNPCVRCNRVIKFGELYRAAEEKIGKIDYFATGHYAKIEYDSEKERYLLYKAVDDAKDQTYFLGFLTQEQLSRTLFPLSSYTKPEVRELAMRAALPQADRAESQDFMGGHYRLLFSSDAKSGDVVDANGKVIGSHNGIENYTIGQRKRLPSVGYPIFVTRIDAQKNVIHTGTKELLLHSEMTLEECNFIAVDTPLKPIKASVKIRQQHRPASATISPTERGVFRVVFDEPQLSITPGQAAVIYDGDVVVGAGIIG
ncbi:tRNA 2-thiouridine(34) synthase MnmA [bacterium]|nr:tRNA 2-thiouridine(34) synthase MnmA [bacterium]